MEVKGMILPIILGLVFISVIVAITQPKTFPDVNSQTQTWANNTNYSLTYDNLVAGSQAVYNGTRTFVEGSDYIIDDASGTINMSNISTTAHGTVYVDYNYYPDEYVSNTPTRNLLPIVNLAWVVGVLMLIFSYTKKEQ